MGFGDFFCPKQLMCLLEGFGPRGVFLGFLRTLWLHLEQEFEVYHKNMGWLVKKEAARSGTRLFGSKALAMSSEDVLNELGKFRGKQFAPEVLEIFFSKRGLG